MSWFDIALENYYQRQQENQKALTGAIAQIGQAGAGLASNATANQQGAAMANSGAFAPRAGLLAPGVNPTTGQVNTIAKGVNTVGAVPAGTGGPDATHPATFTGGRQGLEQAIAMQKANQNQNALTSEIALRKAQTGEAEGRTAAMGANSMANYIKAMAAQRNSLNKQPTLTPAQKAAQMPYTIEDLAKEINIQVPGSVDPDDPQKLVPAAKGIIAGIMSKSVNRGKLVEDPPGSGNKVWEGDVNGPLVSFNPSTTAYGTTAESRPSEQAARPYTPFTQAQLFARKYQMIGQQKGQAAQSGGQQAGGNTPRVQSTQDPAYTALPPGSQFIDPNGVLRTKGGAAAPPAGNPNAGSTPISPQGGDVPQTPGQLNMLGPDGKPMQMPGT